MIYAIADMHGNLPEIPSDATTILIAGDICPDDPIGRRERYALADHGASYQLQWLDTVFRRWLSSRPDGCKVVAIAGNHDFVFEREPQAVRELHLPWTYLQDQECEIEGDMRVWGTPWVPGLPRWAFYASDHALSARALSIPKGIDFLLSHGPPFGFGDEVAPMYGGPKYVGDISLGGAIIAVEPKLTICGHIHEGRGEYVTPEGHRILNASMVDERYRVHSHPWIRVSNQPAL